MVTRFELADLLVALCDAGEVSLAKRLARAFWRDDKEREETPKDDDGPRTDGR